MSEAVVKGALPGFEYALFPCATGVALLPGAEKERPVAATEDGRLVFSRVFTFMMAQPLWVLRPRCAGACESLAHTDGWI